MRAAAGVRDRTRGENQDKCSSAKSITRPGAMAPFFEFHMTQYPNPVPRACARRLLSRNCKKRCNSGAGASPACRSPHDRLEPAFQLQPTGRDHNLRNRAAHRCAQSSAPTPAFRHAPANRSELQGLPCSPAVSEWFSVNRSPTRTSRPQPADTPSFLRPTVRPDNGAGCRRGRKYGWLAIGSDRPAARVSRCRALNGSSRYRLHRKQSAGAASPQRCFELARNNLELILESTRAAPANRRSHSGSVSSPHWNREDQGASPLNPAFLGSDREAGSAPNTRGRGDASPRLHPVQRRRASERPLSGPSHTPTHPSPPSNTQVGERNADRAQCCDSDGLEPRSSK